MIGTIGALVVLVAGWAEKRRRARRRERLAQHLARATIDAGALARAIRATNAARAKERLASAEAARLRLENEQLAELGRKRHELLVAACEALELTLPEPARDHDLLQAIRVAAGASAQAMHRLRCEIELRNVALAALGTLALGQPIAPGQHSPQKLIALAEARRCSPPRRRLPGKD